MLDEEVLPPDCSAFVCAFAEPLLALEVPDFRAVKLLAFLEEAARLEVDALLTAEGREGT